MAVERKEQILQVRVLELEEEGRTIRVKENREDNSSAASVEQDGGAGS